MGDMYRRKKHYRRKRKTGTDKRRRVATHKKRLVALGVSEEKVSRLNTAQIRKLLRKPKKLAKKKA